MGTRGPRRKVRVAPASSSENVKLMRCPTWLDVRGKQIWNDLLKRLAATGVLRTVDRHALGLLCNDMSKLERYERELSEVGEIYTTPKGELRRHPLVMIHRQTQASVLQLMKAFGMTPNAGSLIGSIPEPMETKKEGKIHYFRQPTK